MRFARLVAACAAAVFAIACFPAAAQETIWQEIARSDADAALRLIEENHPGARPEVGDSDFLARLARAREHVAERLPKVANYQG